MKKEIRKLNKEQRIFNPPYEEQKRNYLNCNCVEIKILIVLQFIQTSLF